MDKKIEKVGCNNSFSARVMIRNIAFIWIFFLGLTTLSLGKTTDQLDTLLIQYDTIENYISKDAHFERINDVLDTLNKDSAIIKIKSITDHCINLNKFRSAGLCYYFLGKAYKSKGELFPSYKAYLDGKSYFENSKDLLGLAAACNGLGGLYILLNDFKQSLTCFESSISYYKELNDLEKEGWIYQNIGSMYENQDSLVQAHNYLKRAEKVFLEVNSKDILSCYINLGIVNDKLDSTMLALYYFDKVYELAHQIGELRDNFNANFYLGKFHFERGNNEVAEKYIKKLELITAGEDYLNVLHASDFVKAFLLLSKYSEVLNEYENAYQFLIKAMEYEDKIKIASTNLELARLKFEKELSDSERERKTRELIIGLTLIALLFSLLLMILFYRNYRNKQKANRLLTEMDELKNQMFSNITHEFRTPLMLILGPLEQMLSEEAQSKPSKQQMQLMRKNAHFLLNLVNQMLELSKIDAGASKIELSESDIVKFIQVQFLSFQSLAEHKQQEYHCYFPPDEKIRLFDVGKLEKILNNLISNAIKFTPKNGQIFCFASFPKPDHLEIIIQDTGEGIPEKELASIFNRFTQLNSKSNAAAGTGIGLALTKELVDLMHGNIEVKSIAGEGTKFTMTLPLGKQHLAKEEYTLVEGETSLTPVEQISLENDVTEETEQKDLPAILIAEDHLEIREFLRECLKNRYQIEMAENGKEGIEKALEIIPDLIISDLMMPQADGIELCQTLKKNVNTSHIPIIILTARNLDEDKLTSLESGADAFLLKPVNIRELQTRIKSLIEQRKNLRERFAHKLITEPREIEITSADDKFLHRVMDILEENMDNAEFEVKELQEKMFMSKMQLYRKVKALTNQNPSEFIRTVRLKRAQKLLEANFGNIAQIAFEVGFNNPSYFSKCYKELFGYLPSEYKNTKKEE